MTIHPDASADECMEYIGELEREIERQHIDYGILKHDYDANQREIERLRGQLGLAARLEEIAQRDIEIERLREALERILQWSESYPVDIFHEPSTEECRRAHEILTANGMTLDVFSAAMGRHCTKGVGDIARRVLGGKTR